MPRTSPDRFGLEHHENIAKSRATRQLNGRSVLGLALALISGCDSTQQTVETPVAGLVVLIFVSVFGVLAAIDRWMIRDELGGLRDECRRLRARSAEATGKLLSAQLDRQEHKRAVEARDALRVRATSLAAHLNAVDAVLDELAPTADIESTRPDRIRGLAGRARLLVLRDGHVLSAVADERLRQDEKWGEQNHPDLSPEIAGLKLELVHEEMCVPMAHTARSRVEHLAARRTLGYADIALEEFAEAIEAAALSNVSALRTELVQTAAVLVAWIASIDRRAEGKAP